MKRLLAVLMFFGGSALLAMGAAGASAGGDALDNVVQIERLLSSTGKDYNYMINQYLTVKKALLSTDNSKYSLEALNRKSGFVSRTGYFYVVFPLEAGASERNVEQFSASSGFQSPKAIAQLISFSKSKHISEIILTVFEGNDSVPTGTVLDSTSDVPLALIKTVIMVSYGDRDPAKDHEINQIELEIQEIYNLEELILKEIGKMHDLRSARIKIASKSSLSNQLLEAQQIKNQLQGLLESINKLVASYLK